MKTLKDLKGVRELTKDQQRSIAGGVYYCGPIPTSCPRGWTCYYGEPPYYWTCQHWVE